MNVLLYLLYAYFLPYFIQELLGPAKYGRRNYAPEHTLPQLNDIRRNLAALNDLWKQLQVQVMFQLL